MDEAQLVPGDENVDIGRKSFKAVREKRHASRDGIQNVQGIKAIGDLLHRLENGAFALEMQAPLVQTPPQFALESLLVRDHAACIPGASSCSSRRQARLV